MIYVLTRGLLGPPGTPLSDIAEGGIVGINESGSPVEFYVAKHDYESALNGAGRTLVVRKDALASTIQWNASNSNVYANSTVDSFLNGDYKGLLSGEIVQIIGQTSFYCTVGGGNVSLTTISRPVFLLSAKELGATNANGVQFNQDGSELPISTILRTISQMTRTVYAYSSNITSTFGVYFCVPQGVVMLQNASDAGFPRPAFTLPSDTTVDDNMFIA